MIEYLGTINTRITYQDATDIGNYEVLQDLIRGPIRILIHYLDYWICITVITDLRNETISRGRNHGETIMEAFGRTD